MDRPSRDGKSPRKPMAARLSTHYPLRVKDQSHRRTETTRQPLNRLSERPVLLSSVSEKKFKVESKKKLLKSDEKWMFSVEFWLPVGVDRDRCSCCKTWFHPFLVHRGISQAASGHLRHSFHFDCWLWITSEYFGRIRFTNLKYNQSLRTCDG
jgi:hypothetical protein